VPSIKKCLFSGGGCPHIISEIKRLRPEYKGKKEGSEQNFLHVER